MDEPRTLTDLLRHCENQLGWQAPLGNRAKTLEVYKFKKVIAKNPELYTIRNFMLAIEYCRIKQIEVEHPAMLCGYIDAALERACDYAPLTDVEKQCQDAIEYELDLEADDSDEWIGRLARAVGPGLYNALTAWRARRFPGSER